jgi:uncharacterized membrane protein YdjX (TVP38/TMEM64 family)
VDPEPQPRFARAVRRAVLAILVLAFVAGAIVLWQTGVATPANVRDWLDSLGPAAPVLFVIAFVLGAFIGLPGMAFVVGGRLAFGPYLGMVLGYTGGMLAVIVPFVAARRLRKRGPPWRPKRRLLARAFDQLSTHPFRAVLVLRLVLWFNPPLSYALAFSPISLRTYVAACAVALVPVVATAMIATGWLA